MSLADPYVQSKPDGDSAWAFTITLDDEDFQFSVTEENGVALVEYEETQSWRGEIRVKEPREEVFKALMTSEEMTLLLDEEGLEGVRRAAPKP